MRAETSNDRLRLLDRLQGAETALPDRLAALSELGLSTTHLRQALAVSPESLRLWSAGGSIRKSNRLVIDNIGETAGALLKSLDEPAVVKWLTTSPKGSQPPPLELIRSHPAAVLSAAEAHVAGRAAEARTFLEQAGPQARDQADRGPEPPEQTDRSSTQVKKNLLAWLYRSTANNASSREVVRRLDPDFAPEYQSNPNYDSYRELLQDVRKLLIEAGDQPAQRVISDFLFEKSMEEEELKKAFEKDGARLIKPGYQILTYALSMRVIHALWGASPSVQSTCRLYVAEGRVKGINPSDDLPPFADAAEIFSFLEDTGYERYIIPDAVMTSRITEGKVDLVMLGAQKVFLDQRPPQFVNTTGTDAILRAAIATPGVKVAIFAETDKISKEKPDAEPRMQIIPVELPPTQDGASSRHGRLMTISSELCKVEGYEHGDGNDPFVLRPRDEDE
jgi:translation initiation factor 2B subunit (eIF-2B alpha/beta/delta family)